MKKQVPLIILLSTLSIAALAPIGVLVLSRNAPENYFANEGDYSLDINEDNPLIGGNVYNKGGTKIHFDEYGVNENVDGGILELAAYGSISLQTYINGISNVEVWSEQADDKFFYLTIGATPNAAEFTFESQQGHASLDMNYFEGDCFYFSIHNKTEKPIKIERILISYTCEDLEKGLRTMLDQYMIAPRDITYNGKAHNPYYGDIPESSIPSNRKVIPTMSKDEYPIAPGRYVYGYEVYDVDSENNPRKLLYTITKEFRIIGTRFNPNPDYHKVLTFHIPDENGNEKLIFQETDDNSYNLANLPSECLQYSWDSPYNIFKYIGDQHYYPVFRVSGISSMKEGDGCYPVHLTYSYAEKGFEMPDPAMKPGYQFGGWYLDQELNELYDPSKMYPGNLVLYAKCIETDLDIKRIYYHYEDGSLANRVDYLTSDDAKLTLPEAASFMDLPRTYDPFYWSITCGNRNLGIFKQDVPSTGYQGDKIKYTDFSKYPGDVHAYATEAKRIPLYDWTFDLFTVDGDRNNVFQHRLMSTKYEADKDFVIPGYAVRQRDNTEYHDQADSFTVDRLGQFFMTDEKKAAIVDGGTLKTISSYGYGNIEMRKPLGGILRHESVKEVGRRAFFNRYGLKGTYFPKNATEFDIEAYANVTFDRILTLPKTLTKIGDRCFLGSQNIEFVCLPRSIKTIGRNAFAYATYNKNTRVYENITDRTVPGNTAITFLYEGSEKDFNKLDEVTKDAIKNNAYKIVYNYDYSTYYGRGE